MLALVTGASSGLGRDMARALHARGYDLILVARREERLRELQKELSNAEIIAMDLSVPDNCMVLYESLKEREIDVVINNAGFGAFGFFDEVSLETELSMIQTNVVAVHILTKLFLQDFLQKDKGYIMNVSSSASFLPGPLMAGYYSTKAYVLRLTQAVWEELKKKGSHVSVSVFCPGPVETEFNRVANVEFSVKSLQSRQAANYAVKKMFDRKMTIVPGARMKLLKFLIRLAPDRLLLRVSYHIQHRKRK